MKDICDHLILKLEEVEKLNSDKEMKTISCSLYSDEKSNFLCLVGKLGREIKCLVSRLFCGGNYY